MNRSPQEERAVRIRTMAFFLLCFLIITLNSVMFPPPAPVPPANKEQAGENGGADADKPAPNGDQPNTPEKAPGGESAENTAENKSDAAQDTAKPAVHPQRWVTLGSLDPADGCVMLVTLCSTGASIESAELNNSKLIDSEDRTGYLGNLGFSTAEGGGCRLDVVGRGTPAFKAGLRAGDIVTNVAGQEITNGAVLLSKLAETRPNQSIEVEFARGQAKQKVTCKLGRRPVEVLRPEWMHEPKRNHGKGPLDPRSLLVGLTQLGNQNLQENEVELGSAPLRNEDWKLVENETNETAAVFEYEFPGKLLIRKRYEVAKAGEALSMTDRSYHLNVTLTLKNLGQGELPLAYSMDGPTGLPTEGWWYAQKVSPYFFRAAGMRDLWLRFSGSQPTLYLLSEVVNEYKAKKQEMLAPGAQSLDGIKKWTGTKPLEFMGVDAQYFSAILVPRPKDPSEVWFSAAIPLMASPKPKEAIRDKLANITFRLEGKRMTLAEGEEQKQDFELFLGPKKPELLRQYKQTSGDLGEIMYYGWFGFVARPMLALLHFFYAIVRNHALAIVMLTAAVKLCMLPVTRNQVRMMHKMQQLQPEMKAIADKHPQDLMARNQETQALFKRHGVNQFGGCLPALVQLPIFVGLYKALMVDIDLRQSPLISQAVNWCTNLAAPDQLFYWKHLIFDALGNETGWLGPFFNVLPLVTIGVFLWQNRMMMPPAVDEQQKMQQNMMIYMTMFMGVMFFKVASGLCLYIIVSSLWSLGERKLLTKSAIQGQTYDAVQTTPPTNTVWGNLMKRGEVEVESPADKKKRRQQARKK